MNFFVEMALSVVFATLKEFVHDKKKKKDLQKAMLKLRDTITLTYGE